MQQLLGLTQKVLRDKVKQDPDRSFTRSSMLPISADHEDLVSFPDPLRTNHAELAPWHWHSWAISFGLPVQALMIPRRVNANPVATQFSKCFF